MKTFLAFTELLFAMVILGIGIQIFISEQFVLGWYLIPLTYGYLVTANINDTYGRNPLPRRKA